MHGERLEVVPAEGRGKRRIDENDVKFAGVERWELGEGEVKGREAVCVYGGFFELEKPLLFWVSRAGVRGRVDVEVDGNG